MFWTWRSLRRAARGFRGACRHGVLVRDEQGYDGYSWSGRSAFCGVCCRSCALACFGMAARFRRRAKAEKWTC